jgi:hypothetical protein
MPSTVIPKIWSDSHENWQAFFFFFFQIPASLNLSEKIFLAGSMASEKRVRRISPDSSEFAGFRPLFKISPDSDKISPKLLLRHFGEKKITVEGILGKST